MSWCLLSYKNFGYILSWVFVAMDKQHWLWRHKISEILCLACSSRIMFPQSLPWLVEFIPCAVEMLRKSSGKKGCFFTHKHLYIVCVKTLRMLFFLLLFTACLLRGLTFREECVSAIINSPQSSKVLFHYALDVCNNYAFCDLNIYYNSIHLKV